MWDRYVPESGSSNNANQQGGASTSSWSLSSWSGVVKSTANSIEAAANHIENKRKIDTMRLVLPPNFSLHAHTGVSNQQNRLTVGVEGFMTQDLTDKYKMFHRCNAAPKDLIELHWPTGNLEEWKNLFTTGV